MMMMMLIIIIIFCTCKCVTEIMRNDFLFLLLLTNSNVTDKCIGFKLHTVLNISFEPTMTTGLNLRLQDTASPSQNN
jgi:hypothetical protein